MKFDRSACIEPMYSEIPFLDRFQAAKDDGFEYVEFWSWTDKDLDAVKAAAEKAGVGYLRLLRPASPLPENCLVFESAKQAAEALAAKEGNLLLATGAKELAQFAAIPPERLYPRVLPTLESITACEAANIPHRNIIAMQGPFSFALNQAMMEQFHIRWLVTKDGGAAGGFDEKAAAASAAGAQLVVIRRPPEQGETASEVLKRCKEMIR